MTSSRKNFRTTAVDSDSVKTFLIVYFCCGTGVDCCKLDWSLKTLSDRKKNQNQCRRSECWNKCLGLRQKEGTGVWRKGHSEELFDWYSSDAIRMSSSKGMRYINIELWWKRWMDLSIDGGFILIWVLNKWDGTLRIEFVSLRTGTNGVLLLTL